MSYTSSSWRRRGASRTCSSTPVGHNHAAPLPNGRLLQTIESENLFQFFSRTEDQRMQISSFIQYARQASADDTHSCQRAQAVLHQNPDITTHDIDIFTCASDFGNLSHCVHGVEQTFRFVMEAVGGTVFFVRRENSPTLLIPGIRGHGHNFVDEYTAWGTDVKGSTSHQ
ncbi:hypothetical protein MaudCBS49596_007324 [Microsporum audouinii]